MYSPRVDTLSLDQRVYDHIHQKNILRQGTQADPDDGSPTFSLQLTVESSVSSTWQLASDRPRLHPIQHVAKTIVRPFHYNLLSN